MNRQGDMPDGEGSQQGRADGLVCVARIAGAFGIRGAVRLASYCDPPEALTEYLPLLTRDRGRQFDISLTGRTKSGLTARIAGVVTRQQAEELRGVRLYAERSRFPETAEEEFYCTDLVNLAVEDVDGTTLGRVTAVFNHGAGDILEVDIPGRDRLLVPLNRRAVPEVRLEAGLVVIDRSQF